MKNLNRIVNRKIVTFVLKIDKEKLTKLQHAILNNLFKESVIAYNYILDHDCWNISHKEIANLESIKTLGSSMIQSIIRRVCNSKHSLAAKHSNAELSRIDNCYSIDLKQYGITHRFISDHRMHIQKLGSVYIYGKDQIPNDAIYANAKLCRTKSGEFYIKQICYIEKERQIKHDVIGIDFGLLHAATLSTGEHIDIRICESKRLNSLKKKLSIMQQNSKNWNDCVAAINKEYDKLRNRKKDVVNKLVSKLLSYEYIVIQDDDIKQWHKNYGKSVQHSVIGMLKRELAKLPNCIILDRWWPTTKYDNGKLLEIDLSIRTIDNVDRDVHAAMNMVYFFETYIKDTIGTIDTSKPVSSRKFWSEQSITATTQ